MPKRTIAAAKVAVAMMVGAGGSLAMAPTASAVGSHNVTLTCQAPTTIYGDIGDTYIFTMANTCDGAYELYNTLDYDNGPPGFLQYVTNVNLYGFISGADWYGYSNGLGTTTVTTVLLLSNGGSTPLSVGGKVAQVDQDSAASAFDIIYGGNVVPNVVGQTPPPPPPPVFQAVVTPISGSCLDVKDDDLNWGGAAPGNWKPSWQQWVNNGAGGSVCQRTLNYVSAGRWAAS